MKKLFKKDQKGFTLAELLIVVAIIAVLVAISIPIFTSQLEKAREATDAANIRAAYAEVAVKVLESEGDQTSDPVTITQTTAGWVSKPKIAEVDADSHAVLKLCEAGDTVTVTVSATDGSITFNRTPKP